MSSQNFLVILLLSSLVSCCALWDLIPILAFLFPHSFVSTPSSWTPSVYCASHLQSHQNSLLPCFLSPLGLKPDQTTCSWLSISSSLLKNSVFPCHLFLCHIMKTCYSSYDPEKQCMQNLPCFWYPSSRGSFSCTHSQLKCSATWLHTRFLLFCLT